LDEPSRGAAQWGPRVILRAKHAGAVGTVRRLIVGGHMSAWVELEARVWRSGSARGGHLLWAECNGVVGWAARRGGPSGGGGIGPRTGGMFFIFILF
jgi:hypothetical protein